MNPEQDTIRTVRAWLRIDEHESADHVLNTVLDLVDVTPQRRSGLRSWRLLRSTPVQVGLAAAVMLLVALIGFASFGARDVGGPGLGTDPPPSPAGAVTPTPTAASSRAGLPTAGPLEPGDHTLTDPFPVDITFTLAEPWRMWSPGGNHDTGAIYQDSADPPYGRGIVFAAIEHLYADPCNPEAGLVDPGPSVRDLADALLAQTNTEGGPPIDVTIDGHQGVYFEMTNTSGQDRECAIIQRWPSEFGNREALVQEHDQVWILDVDGVRIVIDAFSFPMTEPAELAEMRAIVEGLQIQPRSAP